MEIKINRGKIYRFLKKYYQWILGIVFILLLIFNGFIYYQYVYLVVESKPQVNVEQVMLNQKNLEGFLENIETREENLNRVRFSQYHNPFND
ncbi:MAG: hypothetical protein ABIF84_00865 [Patescibacteria group bacterium]